MIKRIITGIILFPALVLLILKAPYWLVFSFLMLTAGICIFEWLNLFDFPGILVLYGELLILNALYWNFVTNFSEFFLFFIFLAGSFLPFLFNYKRETFGDAFFPLFTGLCYVFVGCLSFWKIFVYSRKLLLLFFCVVFASDTGAYFIGKFFGRRPFFPEISPKKTLEGFFGGVLFAITVSILLSYYFNLFNLRQALNIGIMLAIVESIGDLFESAFKRLAGKKDSGKIIWGHGGMLDRIDGALFSAPVFLIALRIFTK
ncbi:MAG: phosphatidate cytidylyltransferase [Thermodesulfobacteria bacterium]|nr:phosphatidate cytidylyltransferase [Thermodesulfobacteriota bacterium]